MEPAWRHPKTPMSLHLCRHLYNTFRIGSKVTGIGVSLKKYKHTHEDVYLTRFYLTLSIPAALAANIVIDKQAGPTGSGLFHTQDYANDAACIQAALDNSNSGDTVTILGGDYYITKGICDKNKSLNIIGEGKVTLHIQTSNKVFEEIFSMDH